MKKILAIIATMHLIIGLIMSTVIINDYISMLEFEKNSSEVEAKITDSIKKVRTSSKGNTTIYYENYVEYVVEDKIYNSSFTSDYQKQIDTKEIIYYFNDDPNIVKDTQTSSILFVLIVIIFPITGATILIVLLIGKIKQNNLKKNGEKIYAQITEYGVDPYVRKNGRCNTKKILCEYKDPNTGTIYEFNKGGIEDNKIIDINQLTYKEVEVFVDKKDFNKYYINHENMR